MAKVSKNEKLLSALSSLPADILSEGLEEVIADILEPAAEWAITGNRPEYELEQIIEDGVVGMMLGGMGQAGAAVGNAVHGAMVGSAETPATAQRVSEARSDEAPAGNLTPAANAGAEAQKNAAGAKPTAEYMSSPAQDAGHSFRPISGKSDQSLGQIATQESKDIVASPAELVKNNGADFIKQHGDEAFVREFSRALEQNRVKMDAVGNLYATDPRDHIDNRDRHDVGDRSMQAFQYQNPEIHPYYEQVASVLLDELGSVQKGGELIVRGQFSDGGQEFLRTKRGASDAIIELRDDYNISYADIEKALRAIIEDKGQENIAVAKRMELLIDELLENDYRSAWGNLSEFIDLDAYRAAKDAIAGASERGDHVDMLADVDAEPRYLKRPEDFTEVRSEEEAPRYLEGDRRNVTAERSAEFQRAEEIARRFGATMEVADVENGADGKYRNGTITISPNASSPVMTVMVHELTHHMETSGRYGQFSKTILDHIARESDVGVSELEAAFKARYAARGITLDSEAARREIVAQYAQENLFRNEQAINRLARENRSLVQTIRDWLSDLAVKLKGTGEERFIRNAERMYERALRSVGDTSGTGVAQYTMGDTNLQRSYIDYNDTQQRDDGIQQAMAQSMAAGNIVQLGVDEIGAQLQKANWDNVREARRYLKDVVTEVMGDSVYFRIGDGTLEAYVTGEARNHFAGTPTAEKAAAMQKFSELVQKSTYAFSSEHDVHSNEGGRVRANVWDSFVVPVQIGEDTMPFIFSVRSIDRDVRAQIYGMNMQTETAFSHGYASQDDLQSRTPNYGGSAVSDTEAAFSHGYGYREDPLGRTPNYGGSAASGENHTTNQQNVNNQNSDAPRYLPAPGVEDTSADTEARYFPTAEDIENGRQYSLGGVSLSDMVEAARPLQTAEEYAAEFEDWREQSLADAANERYMQQAERQGKTQNQPKVKEKSRATQSRKELRQELLNGRHLSLEEWQSLARQVDRISRDMQAEGRVSDEKRTELIRAIAERSGASMADVDALEQQFDDAMRRFADKARLEIELRDSFGERLEREKDAWREVFRKKDDARKQREAAAQTLRNLKRLRKRIGQNDTRLAEAMSRLSPEEQQIAREALGNLSTDAQRLTEKAKAKMAENRELYERMLETDPNYIPDKKTLALLERMDQTYLADMTAEELMSVHRALQTLEQHLTDINKEIGRQRGEEIGALYRASSEEVKKSKGRENTGRVRKFIDEDQLTAMNYLEMLGGWDENSTWNQTVAKQLEEGEQAKKAFIVEANRMVKDFREKNAKWIAKSDGQGKGATWYDIEVPALQEYGEGHKPIFGDTVTVHLTPAMRVELARGVRNDDNLRHAEGGVTFPNKELYSKGQRKEAYDRGTTVKLAPETMKSLFAYENLTSEEKALFDLMDTFFDGKAKAAINETSQIMDGVDRAITNHYSKIYTNKNYRATDATIVNESIGAMPSLQKRVFSRNPMLAMSVWEAFDDTVDTVSKYHGLAIPVRNVNMLLNWTENGQSMKDTLAQKWGGGAVSYVEELLRDLQNPKVKEKTGIDELTGKALNNYVTATFGLNPGIVLKQFSSFPSAAAALGWSNIPKPSKILGKGVDTELIAKYTPELEYRSMGYATPELAELKNNPNWTQQNKVTRFLFGGAIQGMDRFTVKAMWPWAENYVKKNYKSLKPGTDAFYKKTAEVYNEAVGLTQPMYDVMHRAKIMRSGSDLTRAFTMFKTVPLQQQNMLRKAWGEARNATGKAKAEANRNLARTVGSIVAANLMFEGIEFLNQAWKNAAKNYRDDDDELTLASAGEKIVMDALGDMAGMFVGGDETLDILDLFRGKKNLYFAGMETPGISQINAVVESLAKAVNAYRKVAEDVVDIRKNDGSVAQYVQTNGAELLGQFKDLAEDMAVYFGGIPATNLEKYLLGTLRVISPKLEQEYKTLFENTTKRDLSGLTGEALDVRVSDLIDERIKGVSDEAKGELARLYEETGSEVIPTDVPDHFTIGGETLTLSAAQEQTYRSAYTEAIGDALDKLVTGEAYRELSDELRAKAVTSLYNYAKDTAKCTVTGAEKESSTKTAETAAERGLALEKYFAVKAGLAELDELEGDEKAEARVEALRTAKLTPKERSAAYYAFVASDKEKALIEKRRDAGTMADALMALRIDNLQEGDEKTKARSQTLLDAKLSEAEKRDAWLDTAGSMTAESRAGKVELFDELRESGVDFDSWLTFTRDTAGLTSDKDESGKTISGSLKAKVLDVIDGYDLTDAQKDALYFAAGYKESTLQKDAPWYTKPRNLAEP